MQDCWSDVCKTYPLLNCQECLTLLLGKAYGVEFINCSRVKQAIKGATR